MRSIGSKSCHTPVWKQKASIRDNLWFHSQEPPATRERRLVRLDGIEPTTPAWKAEVLPLNYSRENAAEHHRVPEAVKPDVRG